MDEPLFSDNDNGMALDAKGNFVVKAPVEGQEIIFLDGRKVVRKLGATLTVTMGEEKINVRPGSYFFLNLIDGLVQDCIDQMFPIEKRLKELSRSAGDQSIVDIVSKVKAAKEPEQNVDLNKEVVDIIIGKSVELYSRSRELAKEIKALSTKTRFLIAQMIIFDAKQYKGEWKKEGRPPTTDELESVMPLQRLESEFAKEDTENLIHVYFQLNFSEQEKKDFLSLRMPI